jgi:CheY-like chemotaxis protein
LTSQKLPILIVEDNDDFRDLLQSFVGKKGHQAVSVSDGKEALDVLTRIQPSLILMDLSMPVMDGFTAARRIREQERLRQIPIIFLTAHGTLGIELYQDPIILEGGKIDYLPKPIDVQLLDDLIKRLLPEPDQEHSSNQPSPK